MAIPEPIPYVTKYPSCVEEEGAAPNVRFWLTLRWVLLVFHYKNVDEIHFYTLRYVIRITSWSMFSSLPYREIKTLTVYTSNYKAMTIHLHLPIPYTIPTGPSTQQWCNTDHLLFLHKWLQDHLALHDPSIYYHIPLRDVHVQGVNHSMQNALH